MAYKWYVLRLYIPPTTEAPSPSFAGQNNPTPGLIERLNTPPMSPVSSRMSCAVMSARPFNATICSDAVISKICPDLHLFMGGEREDRPTRPGPPSLGGAGRVCTRVRKPSWYVHDGWTAPPGSLPRWLLGGDEIVRSAQMVCIPVTRLGGPWQVYRSACPGPPSLGGFHCATPARFLASWFY